MALKIMPHGRVQEWVAEERGFFTAEGLEYSFVVTDDYGVTPSSATTRARLRPGPSRPSAPGATVPTRAVPATGPRTRPRANGAASW